MDDEVSVYYKWALHEFLEDGSLFMRTSVYRPTSHSSGKFRVAPNDPDFEFWMWVIRQKKPVRRVGEKEYGNVHESQLEALRREYRDCTSAATEGVSTLV